MINRRTRTGMAASPGPDAAPGLDAILAAAPGRSWVHAGRTLRILLGTLGFGQFILGLAQIASVDMARGVGSAGGMSSDHLLHESAAWNVAIGAGYLWIAFRRARPAGVLPVLTAFVGVLLVLSIADLGSGEVVATALLTHVFVALGYIILLILRHPGFDTATPPGRWRLRLRADDGALEDQGSQRVREAGSPVRGATAAATDYEAA